MKNFDSRNGNYETNAVVKNHGVKQRERRSLGDGWQWKANGQCSKETIPVSDTIRISVQNRHCRILLQDLLRSRMREMRREPEVLEVKVPVEECFDCPARNTSKELAQLHCVTSGTLQSACSTRPRVVAGFWKSALTHTARLMNSRAKGPKRMVTKVQWPC